MGFLRLIRVLLLLLAASGYVANGAQAHIRIPQGETLTVLLCGHGQTGQEKFVTLEIPGAPVDVTDDSCCDDGVLPPAIVLPVRALLPDVRMFASPVPPVQPGEVTPRSPLWPGAPPQGPPMFHKA